MWALYEDGKLTPDSKLTGEFAEPEDSADVDAVMREIKAALAEEARRQALLNEDEDKARDEPPPRPGCRIDTAASARLTGADPRRTIAPSDHRVCRGEHACKGNSKSSNT